LTLAYLFPELKVCRQLAPSARQALDSGLNTLVDDGGFLHGRHWPQMSLLLATWTRSRLLGQGLRRGSWDDAAQQRYRELVVQALRGTRSNGTVVFGTTEKQAWPARFWQ
jgi:hypothetical protein